MYEIVATVANLTALTVIGIIYVAYIKNLRSVNQLKDVQHKVSEQNTKLWKDKALELERRSPEFIEKQLSERIKIREEEISRLAKDTESHSEQIDLKNREIELLKDSIEKANQYRNSITVWDKDEGDFVEVRGFRELSGFITQKMLNSSLQSEEVSYARHRIISASVGVERSMVCFSH